MVINVDSYGDNNQGQPINRNTGKGFPPAKGNGIPGDLDYAKSSNIPNAVGQKISDNGGATSTGGGGIAASLKIKNTGTKDTPGVEHNVNLF